MKISREIALEVFNLKEGYTEEELKSAYRRLSKICHPDTGGDQNLFVFITSCKDVLQCKINPQNKPDVEKKKTNPSSTTKANSRPTEKIKVDVEVEKIYEFFNSTKSFFAQIRNVFVDSVICMYPTFNKKEKKSYPIRFETEFNFLNCKVDVVDNRLNIKFQKSIIVPEEFKKLKKIRVKIKFMDKTYKFTISKSKKSHIIKWKKKDMKLDVAVNFDF